MMLAARAFLYIPLQFSWDVIRPQLTRSVGFQAAVAASHRRGAQCACIMCLSTRDRVDACERNHGRSQWTSA